MRGETTTTFLPVKTERTTEETTMKSLTEVMREDVTEVEREETSTESVMEVKTEEQKKKKPEEKEEEGENSTPLQTETKNQLPSFPPSHPKNISFNVITVPAVAFVIMAVCGCCLVSLALYTIIKAVCAEQEERKEKRRGEKKLREKEERERWIRQAKAEEWYTNNMGWLEAGEESPLEMATFPTTNTIAAPTVNSVSTNTEAIRQQNAATYINELTSFSKFSPFSPSTERRISLRPDAVDSLLQTDPDAIVSAEKIDKKKKNERRKKREEELRRARK